MSSVSQVKCVKIGHSHGAYSVITLPSTDPIFANSPTPTSVLWAFPLVIRRISSSRSDNQHITWLMIDDKTGFAPPEWQHSIGDAIVARKDRRDLSLNVLSEIVDYVSILLDAFGDSEAVNREQWYSPEKFQRYLSRRIPGVAKEAITSPLEPTIMPSKNPVESAIQLASAHKAKGNLAFQSHEYRHALEHYRDGMKALSDVTERYEYAAATKHVMHALLLNQSLMCYHLGLYADAVFNADQAIGIHKMGLENKEMAKAYFRRGYAKVKMDDRNKEEAKKDLEKAAALAPGDETILRELSYLG